MPIFKHTDRGRNLAERLHRLFSSKKGVNGRTAMPEDILPQNVERGSLDHLLFITLTVSIDYQRDANRLWASSRATFEDPSTRYLYDPRSLHEKRFQQIIMDMQKHGLSKKRSKDAEIWTTVGVSFLKKWGGDPRSFCSDCGWDATSILKRLEEDCHLYAGNTVPDFPFLRGDKIGPLWLRMLRDNVGIESLTNLDMVPIPVDIHVARASLTTGVVRGMFNGRLRELFALVREAWFDSVKGLSVKGRPMIALDVDEPLWNLSKYSCTRRNRVSGECPVFPKCDVQDFCTKGKIAIEKDRVELDT